MEIFFNKLYLLPQCNNSAAARNKIFTLLETMKALKEHDFNILRTHNNFYAEDLGSGYTFSDFINDLQVKKDTKLLLRTIVKNPFIVDDESYEAEMFITSEFETKNYLGTTVTPEGLAVAHVNSLPTLSISGNDYWEMPVLSLDVTDTITAQKLSAQVINLYNPASLGNSAFTEWIKSITIEIELNSSANILKIFPPTNYQFDQKAIDDILSWYYDDKRFLVRIKELLEDIEQNPFTGGKGKTEPLSGTGGKASKRIIKKDRIVYTYSQAMITVHQCRGHYNDN